MNYDMKSRDLASPISRDSQDQLKDIILWTVEGYKYFYTHNMEELANATRRMLYFVSDNILYTDEKEKFIPIRDKETVDTDIDNMKELFNNCYSFTDDYCIPVGVYKFLMCLYLDSDEHFNAIEEFNTFSKCILAAGAIQMHREDIERITGKDLLLITDTPMDEEDIYKYKYKAKMSVLGARGISMKEKRNINRSLDLITSYNLMINNDLINEEYYDVEEIAQQKEYKPRLK